MCIRDRCAPLLLNALIENELLDTEKWDNEKNLQNALNVMLGNLAEG